MSDVTTLPRVGLGWLEHVPGLSAAACRCAAGFDGAAGMVAPIPLSVAAERARMSMVLSDTIADVFALTYGLFHIAQIGDHDVHDRALGLADEVDTIISSLRAALFSHPAVGTSRGTNATTDRDNLLADGPLNESVEWTSLSIIATG